LIFGIGEEYAGGMGRDGRKKFWGRFRVGMFGQIEKGIINKSNTDMLYYKYI